jgi:hypothetical protein
MRDGPMGARIDAEFVVAAPKVLHERVSAHEHSGRAVAFEPGRTDNRGPVRKTLSVVTWLVWRA